MLLRTAVLLAVVAVASSKFVYRKSGSNWWDAVSFCEKEGGVLFAPQSRAEFDEANIYRYGETWVGWSDQETEGVWKDREGNVYQDNWNLWNWGEPNGNWLTNEDCMAVSGGLAGWHDLNCGDIIFGKKSAICKVPDTEEEEGRPYEFVYRKSGSDWYGAERFCQDEGGFLFAPKSREEFEEVNIYKYPEVWSGWSDSESEGVWKDREGNVYQDNWNVWSGGEPNGWLLADEDCMAISAGLFGTTYYDLDCANWLFGQKSAICKVYGAAPAVLPPAAKPEVVKPDPNTKSARVDPEPGLIGVENIRDENGDLVPADEDGCVSGSILIGEIQEPTNVKLAYVFNPEGSEIKGAAITVKDQDGSFKKCYTAFEKTQYYWKQRACYGVYATHVRFAAPKGETVRICGFKIKPTEAKRSPMYRRHSNFFRRGIH